MQSQRTMVTCTCCVCGIVFERYQGHVSRTVFCSRACYLTAPALAEERTPLSERFWPKVQKTEDCWLWTGALNSKGYGSIGAGGRSGGVILAPRAAWELVNGPIPDGLWVLHHCDTPRCVRADPDPSISHLFLGDYRANIADMVSKGRQRSPDQQGEKGPGAKLTDTQVIEIRRRYAQGGTSQARLGAEFNVGAANIGLIVRRKNWRHIA